MAQATPTLYFEVAIRSGPQPEPRQLVLAVSIQENYLRYINKESVLNTIPFNEILSVVRNVRIKESFTLYFKNGKPPLEHIVDTAKDRDSLWYLLSKLIKAENDVTEYGFPSPPTILSGVGKKQGKVLKAERWLALYPGRLLVFRSESGAKHRAFPLHAIFLAHIKVVPDGTSAVMMKCRRRKYTFYFSSPAEREKWLAALQQAVLDSNTRKNPPRRVRGFKSGAPPSKHVVSTLVGRDSVVGASDSDTSRANSLVAEQPPPPAPLSPISAIPTEAPPPPPTSSPTSPRMSATAATIVSPRASILSAAQAISLVAGGPTSPRLSVVSPPPPPPPPMDLALPAMPSPVHRSESSASRIVETHNAKVSEKDILRTPPPPVLTEQPENVDEEDIPQYWDEEDRHSSDTDGYGDSDDDSGDPVPPPPPPEEQYQKELEAQSGKKPLKGILKKDNPPPPPPWQPTETSDEEDKRYVVDEEEDELKELEFVERTRAASQQASAQRQEQRASVLSGVAAADDDEEEALDPSVVPIISTFPRDASGPIPEETDAELEGGAGSKASSSPPASSHPLAAPVSVTVAVKGEPEPLGQIDVEDPSNTTFADLRIRIVDELDDVPADFVFLSQGIPVGKRQEEKKLLSSHPPDTPVLIRAKGQNATLDEPIIPVAPPAPVVPAAPPIDEAGRVSQEAMEALGFKPPGKSPTSSPGPVAHTAMGDQISAKIKTLRDARATPAPVKQRPKHSVVPAMLASLSAALQRRRQLLASEDNDRNSVMVADHQRRQSGWDEAEDTDSDIE